MKAIWFESLDSTNAEARRLAEKGETGPVWIASRWQIGGRGRRGRRWSSGTGDLAATLLTVSDRSPAEAAGISFVAALAVAELLDAYVPASLVRLKWPNDGLVAGAKVSGILVESGSRADGGIWLAVGIGVNLTSAPELGRPVTTVAAHLRPDRMAAPTPDEALQRLAQTFDRWSRVWEADGLGPVLEAWSARATGIPGACVAQLPAETLAGEAEGLDADGALRLRLADGSLRRITAGDVFFGEG